MTLIIGITIAIGIVLFIANKSYEVGRDSMNKYLNMDHATIRKLEDEKDAIKSDIENKLFFKNAEIEELNDAIKEIKCQLNTIGLTLDDDNNIINLPGKRYRQAA